MLLVPSLKPPRDQAKAREANNLCPTTIELEVVVRGMGTPQLDLYQSLPCTQGLALRPPCCL